jgi:uncharacterized membrane protein
VAGGAAPPPPPPAGPGPYATAVQNTAPMADNVASALCYALGLITGIIFLVLEPYSKNRTIRFHAFQSIFMHVAIIAIYIVCTVVIHILTTILGFFGFLAILFYPLMFLVSLCLWLYLLITAYQGKMVVLPVIGPIAQKQAQS